MRAFTKEELTKVIELHEKWLKDEQDGVRANLSYADLSYADLSSADLRYADLSYADLSLIKESFMKILEVSHKEFVGLYHALQTGTVDGSQYEEECACLVGTIAKLRNEKYTKLSIDLSPNSSSPSEKWFLGISKNDTPMNSQISKITCEWIEEFAKTKNIELPTYKIYSSFEIEEVRGLK